MDPVERELFRPQGREGLPADPPDRPGSRQGRLHRGGTEGIGRRKVRHPHDLRQPSEHHHRAQALPQRGGSRERCRKGSEADPRQEVLCRIGGERDPLRDLVLVQVPVRQIRIDPRRAIDKSEDGFRADPSRVRPLAITERPSGPARRCRRCCRFPGWSRGHPFRRSSRSGAWCCPCRPAACS